MAANHRTIAAVLACGSEHVSAIEAGAPLAANRATVDAALLSQLMSPASIGNDALAYLVNTYRRAHQSGEDGLACLVRPLSAQRCWGCEWRTALEGQKALVWAGAQPREAAPERTGARAVAPGLQRAPQRLLTAACTMRPWCVGSVCAGADELVIYIKKQCISYSALVLLQPGSFSGGAAATSPAEGPRRLLDLLKGEGTLTLPGNFFGELVAHMKGLELPGYPPASSGGALQVLFVGHNDAVVPLLIDATLKTSLIDNYAWTFRVTAELLAHPALAHVICESDYWIPAAPSARSLEQETLFGPLFRLSCIPESSIDPQTGRPVHLRHPVGQACFSQCSTRSRDEVDIEVSNVRLFLQGAQSQLVEIWKKILKDPKMQERVFQWVSAVLTHNAIRTKEGFRFGFMGSRVSSNGFLLNLLAVLLKLCKPFADPEHPKALWHKIDATWVLSKHRLDLSNETRTGHEDREQNQEGGAAQSGGAVADITVSDSFGTITEFFFLAVRALHVINLELMVKDMDKLNRELHNLHSTARAAADGSEEREQAEAQLAQSMERRLCSDVVMQDQTFIEDMLMLARLCGRFLLRNGDAPKEMLPLPDTPPAIFKAMPEFVVECPAEVLKAVASLSPPVLETLGRNTLDDVVAFLMAYSSGSPDEPEIPRDRPRYYPPKATD